MFLGVVLYGLANWSYTVSSFTDPGSPISSPYSNGTLRHNYSHLPTTEPATNPELPSFTVKASGAARYCKKCKAKKPDRAHHCSTCRRCVLKMDHHCPWLATCVGLRNYKAFILFCAYTTLFCWVCFGVSVSAVMSEIASDAFERGQGMLGVNMVLLAVLSGIIGLVLAGFTGWHFSLAVRNQTTIECLEKTRYMSPLRKTVQRAQQAIGGSGDENATLMQRYGQQLTEIHANALPGITVPEEGEDTLSTRYNIEDRPTAQQSLRMNYSEMEAQRERERYENYLDEQDSEKLPHAFDLGWRRNLWNLFGENKLLWFFPICNSIGDGWHWDPSPKWLAAREQIRHERETQWNEQLHREESAGWGATRAEHSYPYDIEHDDNDGRHYLPTSNGVASVPVNGRRSASKANQILGRYSGQYADEGFSPATAGRPGSGMSMKTLKKRGEGTDTASLDGLYDNEDAFEESSDEEEARRKRESVKKREEEEEGGDEWRDWD